MKNVKIPTPLGQIDEKIYLLEAVTHPKLNPAKSILTLWESSALQLNHITVLRKCENNISKYQVHITSNFKLHICGFRDKVKLIFPQIKILSKTKINYKFKFLMSCELKVQFSKFIMANLETEWSCDLNCNVTTKLKLFSYGVWNNNNLM